MTEYRIICRVVDTTGVILKVGISDGMYSVEKIYDWIKAGTHNFYTYEECKRAEVRIGISPQGKKYLTTNPDSKIENNLKELKAC